MSRSIAKMRSMRCTASIASGEMTTRLPRLRFSWVAMSASSKKYRLAWAQQAAWVIVRNRPIATAGDRP